MVYTAISLQGAENEGKQNFLRLFNKAVSDETVPDDEAAVFQCKI
jgi:hypothetical protein